MGLRYYKLYREQNAKAVEITKAEARQTLEGYWADLDRIFDNDIGFQLYTPYAIVWTAKVDENGHTLVPMAGFYGTLE